MKVVGIDFSMNGPAVCLHDGDQWSYDNCRFYYLTNKLALLKNRKPDKFKGELFDKSYKVDTERFLLNANMIREFIQPEEGIEINFEGYAFAAGKSSRKFQIAEATGILKTLLIYDLKGNLINEGKSIHSVAPPTVKKFATDNGRADKEMMFAAFFEETGDNLLNVFNMKKLDNPIHDLVDSYWIAKYQFAQLQNTN